MQTPFLEKLRTPISALTHFALPHLCCHCHQVAPFSSSPALCDSCSDIYWDHSRCQRCDRPCHPLESQKNNCHYCRHSNFVQTSLQTLGAYDGWLKHSILSYKFSQDELALNYLIQITTQFNRRRELGETCITSIPSHSKRLKERGYRNQHLPPLLVQLEKKWNLPHQTLLLKNTHRQAQIDLKSDERKQAIEGTLSYVGPSPAPKTVYLFDDVWTTGSTMKEAGRVLRKHGVERIHMLCLARPDTRK